MPDSLITRQEIRLKQEEAKTLQFTFKDADDVAVNVSTATLSFQVKKKKGDDPVLEKVDGDFDKTGGASGIVTVPLSSTDTKIEARRYVCEIRAQFAAGNIDLSDDIDFVVESSVHRL